MKDDVISRHGVSAWLDNMGYSKLAGVIMDEKRFPSVQQWISCNVRLPKENVYVLVWCGEVRIARIIRGISKEQRAKMQEGTIDDPVSYGWNLSNGYFKVKRSESYRTCDENGNNKVPYCWDCIHGEMFGQDVKAWLPLPKAYVED